MKERKVTAVRASVSAEKIETIKRLNDEGKVGWKIAAEVGLSVSVVNKYRRLMRLEGDNKPQPEPEAKEEPSTSVCDAHCGGCIHLTEVCWGGLSMACYYRINTGKKRPCPAGKGCTVKETGERKQRLIDPW